MPHPRYAGVAEMRLLLRIGGGAKPLLSPAATRHPQGRRGRPPFRCFAAIPCVGASASKNKSFNHPDLK